MSNFSWKIQHTDLFSRSMVVEYTKDGVSIPLNIPMPQSNDEIISTINRHAPIVAWEQAKKPVASVIVGMTGTGLSTTAPTTLCQIKATASGKINQMRDMIIDAGVIYKSYQFASDEQTINRLTAIITSAQTGIPLREDFAWRSTINEMIPMTLSELCELLNAMTRKITSTYSTAWEKKQQINDASTEEEVAAVTWTDLAVGVKL